MRAAGNTTTACVIKKLCATARALHALPRPPSISKAPRLETGVQLAQAALRTAVAAGRMLEALVRGLQLVQRHRLSRQLSNEWLGHKAGPCRASRLRAPERAAARCPASRAAGRASGSRQARQAEHGQPPVARQRARPTAGAGAAARQHGRPRTRHAPLDIGPSLAVQGHAQRTRCTKLPSVVRLELGTGRYCLAAWPAAHEHKSAPDPVLTWVNPGVSHLVQGGSHLGVGRHVRAAAHARAAARQPGRQRVQRAGAGGRGGTGRHCAAARATAQAHQLRVGGRTAGVAARAAPAPGAQLQAGASAAQSLRSSTGAAVHTEQELCVTPADPCMSRSLPDLWCSLASAEAKHCPPLAHGLRSLPGAELEQRGPPTCTQSGTRL